MGRPPLGDKAKSKHVIFRVTPADMRALKADARKQGGTVGDMLTKLWRESKGD